MTPSAALADKDIEIARLTRELRVMQFRNSHLEAELDTARETIAAQAIQMFTLTRATRQTLQADAERLAGASNNPSPAE